MRKLHRVLLGSMSFFGFLMQFSVLEVRADLADRARNACGKNNPSCASCFSDYVVALTMEEQAMKRFNAARDSAIKRKLRFYDAKLCNIAFNEYDALLKQAVLAKRTCASANVIPDLKRWPAELAADISHRMKNNIQGGDTLASCLRDARAEADSKGKTNGKPGKKGEDKTDTANVYQCVRFTTKKSGSQYSYRALNKCPSSVTVIIKICKSSGVCKNDKPMFLSKDLHVSNYSGKIPATLDHVCNNAGRCFNGEGLLVQ